MRSLSLGAADIKAKHQRVDKSFEWLMSRWFHGGGPYQSSGAQVLWELGSCSE